MNEKGICSRCGDEIFDKRRTLCDKCEMASFNRNVINKTTLPFKFAEVVKNMEDVNMFLSANNIINYEIIIVYDKAFTTRKKIWR